MEELTPSPFALRTIGLLLGSQDFSIAARSGSLNKPPSLVKRHQKLKQKQNPYNVNSEP
jgi:hypothetical protein